MPFLLPLLLQDDVPPSSLDIRGVAVGARTGVRPDRSSHVTIQVLGLVERVGAYAVRRGTTGTAFLARLGLPLGLGPWYQVELQRGQTRGASLSRPLRDGDQFVVSLAPGAYTVNVVLPSAQVRTLPLKGAFSVANVLAELPQSWWVEFSGEVEIRSVMKPDRTRIFRWPQDAADTRSWAVQPYDSIILRPRGGPR